MRVSFLVDGFNLYHSLRQTEAERKDGGYRWLDLRSLFTSYLEHIDRQAYLGEIVYFSALATHTEVNRECSSLASGLLHSYVSTTRSRRLPCPH